MRLQTKVLVITIVLAVAVSGAVLALLNYQLNQQLGVTETTLARQTALQARSLIRSRLADLERLAVELQPAAIARLRDLRVPRPLPASEELAGGELNLVMLVSVDGEVRHTAAWHPARGVVEPTAIAPWTEVAPAGLEYFSFNPASPGTGIALTPDGPLEMTSLAIVIPADNGENDGASGSGPDGNPHRRPEVAGSLLVGRLVGEVGTGTVSSRWESVLLHTIRVRALTAPGPTFADDITPDVEITSPTEVVARFVEADASGRRWIEMEVASRRIVWLSGQANIVGAMLGLVFSGLAITMAFLGTLRFLVLRRVARLARAAEHVRHPGDLMRRVDDDSPDEIGTLVRAFNTMLDRLDDQTDRLRTANRKLVTALQAKDEFLHTLSHELRTPLTTIRGFAERLATLTTALSARTDIDDEASSASIAVSDGQREVERATGHLLALINDLLDLARARAGRLEVADGPVDVADVLADAASLLRVQAEEKSLAVVVEVPDDLPPVRGDYRRLTQALANLLGNAVKFSDAGTIRASARTVSDSDGGWIEIDVSDEGPGIPPDRLDDIFEPFVRLVAAGKPRPGTGLGLAISRELITRMHGRLTATSAPGNGATFTVRMQRFDT